jgi:hypothetical protein
MVNFSIFDVIGNDNDFTFDERDYKKLQVPPAKLNRELTAAQTEPQRQTKKYFSIYDSIG